MSFRPTNPEWHREQVIKATRHLLEYGGTIEDGLDCIVEAARREFGGIRVFVHRPAELRVDGVPYQWPVTRTESKSDPNRVSHA
jgi:hypothetical protein